MTIIVPYRDRAEHLMTWMPHIAQYLSSCRFRVLVIEQADASPFNRGALLNVGFQLSRNEASWVVFHDIDMLPISTDCDYSRPLAVSHISNRIEQFGFTLPYRNYIGGVVTCTVQAFTEVNGFSNKYAGWGCEDDDFFVRCVIAKLPIERRTGVFKSLRHPRPSRVAANDRQFAEVINKCFSGTNVGVPHIDARLFRRVKPNLFLMQAEAGFTYMQTDGLTTVNFMILNRCPLRTRFVSLATVEERHEIITVRLGE